MRNIILDLAVTLDGFIEGQNGEVDWCIMDDDMGFDSFLTSIDSIFYGRISYELWGNFQLGQTASETERKLWENIHGKKKFVFSKNEKHENGATWINKDMVNKVKEIKSEQGKDIWLYGGANLIASFVEHDLIDIYRLGVHPTILGRGKPLFSNLRNRVYLKLDHVKSFKSGVTLLSYSRNSITTTSR